MVSLHHLRTRAWLLGSHLNLPAVHPLRTLIAEQTTLLVRDQQPHGAVVTQPVGGNSGDDIGAVLRDQHRGSCEPDGFVEQVRYHDVAVVQYVPLHDLVEGQSQSR